MTQFFVSRRSAAMVRGTCLFFLSLLLCSACADTEQSSRESEAREVDVESLRFGPHQASIELLGIVRPSETIELKTEESGSLRYSERFAGGLRTGEHVEEGELLAILESEERRRELEEARARRTMDRTAVRRRRTAHAEGVGTRADLEQAELDAQLSEGLVKSLELRARRLRVLAPRAGSLVVEKATPEGLRVASGVLLAKLAAEGARRVEAWATPADRTVLRPGLEVEFTWGRAGGERRAKGRLSEIDAVVDEAGVLRLWVDADEGAELPLPGEGVELAISLNRQEHVLSIPEDALVVDGGGYAVFTVSSSNYSKRKSVQLGGSGEGRVAIRSGLGEGERVIVSDVAYMRQGVRVNPRSEEGK